MKAQIYAHIKEILGQDFILESPKDKHLAHFATPIAFSMAKELKQNPLAIASNLALKFKDSALFTSVEAVKGYLNFKLSGKFLDTLATQALKEPANFAKNLDAQNLNAKNLDENSAQKPSFLLEFVSANPTGPLHIGHARGAIYGDTLARVARHLGYKFDTEYYINDAGKQIKLLGLSLLLAIKEQCLHEVVEYPESFYRGEYIDELARLAFKSFDKSFFSEANIDALAAWAKDKVLEMIKQTLLNARIKIDNYASEKSYYDRLDSTLKELEKNGGTYESEGKIWLKSSAFGDQEDRVIINDKGEKSYLAADIVYHYDKMRRGYSKCIDIWGADHHGYIARVKAALNFLGLDSSRLEVILVQMVSLLKDGKPFKMSKRAGTVILMQDILDEIGADALRFIFLSKKCDTHLEFDIKTLKKQDSSNPVFYINYAHARICQVFKKAGKAPLETLEADLSKLSDEALNLAFESLNLGAVLKDAFESRALQKLSDYLKALAASFHKFYNENKVLGSAHENALLKLFALVALSLKTGLFLMGIEAKERMEQEG